MRLRPEDCLRLRAASFRWADLRDYWVVDPRRRKLVDIACREAEAEERLDALRRRRQAAEVSGEQRRCAECGQRSRVLICAGPDGPWICPVCEDLATEEQREYLYLRDRDDDEAL